MWATCPACIFVQNPNQFSLLRTGDLCGMVPGLGGRKYHVRTTTMLNKPRICVCLNGLFSVYLGRFFNVNYDVSKDLSNKFLELSSFTKLLNPLAFKSTIWRRGGKKGAMSLISIILLIISTPRLSRAQKNQASLTNVWEHALNLCTNCLILPLKSKASRACGNDMLQGQGFIFFFVLERWGRKETAVSMEFTPLPRFSQGSGSKQHGKHISHSDLKSDGFRIRQLIKRLRSYCMCVRLYNS